MRMLVIGLLVALPLSVSLGRGTVIKRSLWVDDRMQQVLMNGDLEEAGARGFPGWGTSQQGYEVDRQGGHSGWWSARCLNTSTDDRRGLRQAFDLNQQVPTPIAAVGWSRSESVTQSNPQHYSL